MNRKLTLFAVTLLFACLAVGLTPKSAAAQTNTTYVPWDEGYPKVYKDMRSGGWYLQAKGKINMPAGWDFKAGFVKVKNKTTGVIFNMEIGPPTAASGWAWSAREYGVTAGQSYEVEAIMTIYTRTANGETTSTVASTTKIVNVPNP